jgi:hypothetical protein
MEAIFFLWFSIFRDETVGEGHLSRSGHYELFGNHVGTFNDPRDFDRYHSYAPLMSAFIALS